MTEKAKTVVAVVVTSGQAVVVAKRVDQTPPWTFPSGELADGEPYGAAARRIVMREAGIPIVVADEVQIGRRVHPATQRDIVYVAATAEPLHSIKNGDPANLLGVKWATFAQARDLMPDMFDEVSAYLDGLE